MKSSKGKLVKAIFYTLNTNTSRSKCSFKLTGQAANLSDEGDEMRFPCQLKNHHEIGPNFLKSCGFCDDFNKTTGYQLR